MRVIGRPGVRRCEFRAPGGRSHPSTCGRNHPHPRPLPEYRAREDRARASHMGLPARGVARSMPWSTTEIPSALTASVGRSRRSAWTRWRRPAEQRADAQRLLAGGRDGGRAGHCRRAGRGRRPEGRGGPRPRNRGGRVPVRARLAARTANRARGDPRPPGPRGAGRSASTAAGWATTPGRRSSRRRMRRCTRTAGTSRRCWPASYPVW